MDYAEKIIITKTRKYEDTKKENFVLSRFRVFVIYLCFLVLRFQRIRFSCFCFDLITIYRLPKEIPQDAYQSSETEAHPLQVKTGETRTCPSDCRKMLLIV